MRTIIISTAAVMVAMAGNAVAQDRLNTVAEFKACVASTKVAGIDRNLELDKHYKVKSSGDELVGGVSWLLEGNVERGPHGQAAKAVLKGCERGKVAAK